MALTFLPTVTDVERINPRAKSLPSESQSDQPARSSARTIDNAPSKSALAKSPTAHAVSGAPCCRSRLMPIPANYPLVCQLREHSANFLTVNQHIVWPFHPGVFSGNCRKRSCNTTSDKQRNKSLLNIFGWLKQHRERYRCARFRNPRSLEATSAFSLLRCHHSKKIWLRRCRH